jgi:tetratricopeptide (TPR) repeat protein
VNKVTNVMTKSTTQRAKKKNLSSKNGTSLKSATSESKKFSVLSTALQGAAACSAIGKFDEAADAYEQAIKISPNDASVFESYAEALMDAGRPDEAVVALRRAIALDSHSGFEKHMYLGQLLGNSEEAVSELQTGIEILRTNRSSCPENAERHEELAGYEVSALCGIAEILLGIAEESRDVSVLERLDAEIEMAVGQAVAVSIEGSPGGIEASMALANLRLSQGRSREALAAMQRVVSAMRQGLDIIEAINDNNEDIIRGMEMLPPMDVRIAAGKQLLEVQLWKDASSVLASVLYECDFNVEVWYMLALAYSSMSDPENALGALQQARKLLLDPEGFIGHLDEETIVRLEETINGKSCPPPDVDGKMRD